MRVHEQACWRRAYPASARELAEATHRLATFHRLPGLARHAEALADSGIAGTPIGYRFFWPMARWLATRYPALLTIDWSEEEFADRLAAALPLLVTAAEAEALGRAALPPREAIERLRGRRTTDACFLVERIEALPGGDRVREATHDALDVAYRIAGAADGPNRTRAFFAGAPAVIPSAPPDRARPDLAHALARPPRSVTHLPARDGARIVDLAREAMVTRSRDLDAFAHGNPRDVHLVDDGQGLAFALVGVVPERRQLLPAVYGGLTLRNGVPIGYVQLDVLFGNAEVSYNTFATFRHGEAGFVFTRLLAAVRHVFRVASFTIEPYQLGSRNDEGIDSGAWWFYARFGFLPRDRPTLRVARAEIAKKRRNPGYRSGRATLLRLAESHMSWTADPARPAIVTPRASIGFVLAERMAAEAGADRESAVAAAGQRVAAALGLRSTSGWSASERDWWARWAPLLDAIPALALWPPPARRAVLRIVRAKAQESELDYVRRYDTHPLLPAAVLAIGKGARRLR
jgi:hypothetical protein